MITAIDTDILFDMLIPNAQYAQGSKRLLDEAFVQGALVICEVVYPELASQFPSKGELPRFLADTKIRLERSKPEALQRASKAWKDYNKARKKGLQCPHRTPVSS